MTKLEFEKLLIPLIELIDDIEMDLITNILERIDNYDSVRGSLEWYVDKLSELKLLDKDNLSIFKKNKKELKKRIVELSEFCGNHIDNLEKLNDYYEKGLLSTNPVTLYKNNAINTLVNNAIKDTTDIMDLIQTKAIEGSNKAYKNILNKAYIETSSGAYTYTEAIRRAVDEFAEKGIQTVHYKNGKSLSIESVTRRDVITRMNKLTGDCEIERAKELGTNLIYVDQHLGARVRTKYTKHDYEAHAEWQGKKYMIEGSSDKYENLYKATGYGEMLGLKGINCYHNMHPTWEWEKIDERIDLEENKKVREILDKRNYYARKSRYLKQKRLNAKILGDKEDYKKQNQKFKEFSIEYNSFLKEHGLVRDYNREYIQNIQKVEKPVSNYKDVTKEWLDNAIPNSHEVKDMTYFEHNGIRYEVDDKNVVLDYSSKAKEVAEWLENTFGGKIYMVPRVNKPESISTPDYFWKKEFWDLKEITKKATSKNRAVDNVIKVAKKQSKNIILDVSNSKIERNILINQVRKIYSTKGREWVNKIIVIDDKKLLLIYERNKKRD